MTLETLWRRVRAWAVERGHRVHGWGVEGVGAC